ncbi:MAG: tetratricopeptide repeat protein [bacterium]
MKSLFPIGLSVIFCFSISGCITTSQSYGNLRSEISSLKRTINQMQTNQADLVITMQELNGSMISLTEKLEDNQDKMSTLSQKLDDLDANFSQRMDDLSVRLSGQTQKQKPKPSQIYDIAYNDYSQGHYELAIVGFRNYIEIFPNGELTEQSLYYLGESLAMAKKNEEALETFERFIRFYPRSEFIQDAQSKYDSLLKSKNNSKSPQNNSKNKSSIEIVPPKPADKE